MNNFGNIANAMASMQVNEEGGYAVPKDMVGKGNEYAQPVVDKPPGGGGGKSKLRKHREQQLAMQKGDYWGLLHKIVRFETYLPVGTFRGR